MDASSIIQNLSEQKKQIIIGTAAVIAGVAILITYFQSGPNALTYAKAEAAFAEWEAAPQDEGLYRNMVEALASAPSLQKKYEATIAQRLLNTDKINEALIMANRSLVRVKDEVPFHATYAQTSLLIEQGSFQKALENAVALKELMGAPYLSDHKGGSLLYAHNLLRIACLHKELKNRPGERAAWEELEAFLQKKSPVSQLILTSFSEREVDLTQYISERKKSL